MKIIGNILHLKNNQTEPMEFELKDVLKNNLKQDLW